MSTKTSTELLSGGGRRATASWQAHLTSQDGAFTLEFERTHAFDLQFVTDKGSPTVRSQVEVGFHIAVTIRQRPTGLSEWEMLNQDPGWVFLPELQPQFAPEVPMVQPVIRLPPIPLPFPAP